MPRLALIALVVTLAGCPRAAPAGPDQAVAVGQRWRFRFGRGEQTYEVTAVTPQEVRYAVRTSHGDEALGAPLEQTFALRPGPSPLESGEPGPPLRVGARTLDTWVAQEGAHRITTAVTGRTPTFPGVVKVERGDDVLLELIDLQ